MRNISPRRLILGSASPARRKLLQAAGIDPQVVVSDVDETSVEAEGAEEVSLTLAQIKARTVAGRVGNDERDALVLGCDSVLDFDGEVLGKPVDATDATARWLRMRGRSGVLYTGHCLIDLTDGRQEWGVAGTTVHFAKLDDDEIAAYVATGEPLKVAGAFTLDGIGGPFVDRIEGDPSTVIGLSLPLFRALLGRFDLAVADLWNIPPARPAGGSLH